MKILLTGGTGFIGSYLLKSLLENGHEVLAVRRNGSESVIPLFQEPYWVDRNLNDLTVSDFEGVDAVVHLASAGVSPQQATWNDLKLINVDTSFNLIQLAHKAKVRRFVCAGTCFEYGLEGELWDYIPAQSALRPITPYAASKTAAFFLLNSYAQSNPIEFFYGRIFLVYGHGQYHGNLWPSLYEAAQSGRDFPMTSGEQIRDFIPVNHVVLHLQNALTRNDLRIYQPMVLNIGTGVGISVVDFARQQWELFGSTGSLVPGAISTNSPQISRLVAGLTHLNCSIH